MGLVSTSRARSGRSGLCRRRPTSAYGRFRPAAVSTHRPPWPTASTPHATRSTTDHSTRCRRSPPPEAGDPRPRPIARWVPFVTGKRRDLRSEHGEKSLKIGVAAVSQAVLAPARADTVKKVSTAPAQRLRRRDVGRRAGRCGCAETDRAVAAGDRRPASGERRSDRRDRDVAQGSETRRTGPSEFSRPALSRGVPAPPRPWRAGRRSPPASRGSPRPPLPWPWP